MNDLLTIAGKQYKSRLLVGSGKYKDLQSIPPGGKWQESFWVRPKGF